MSLFLVLLMLLLSKKGARSVLCANPKHLIGTCNADIAEHIAGVKTRRRSPTRSKSNEGRLLGHGSTHTNTNPTNQVGVTHERKWIKKSPSNRALA